MNRMVVLGAAVLALMLTPAALAAEKEPRSPSEAKVARLFGADSYTYVTQHRSATLEEVVGFAAATEGLDRQAAFERVTGPESTSPLSTDATVYCSWVEWQNGRGIFPYRRWIVGQTYWCYHYGGEITYRASNTAARVDGVCTGSNARDWKVAGGAGYSWVVVHHEANFSCVTPWWFPLNDTLWMEPAFNSYGNTSMTDAS